MAFVDRRLWVGIAVTLCNNTERECSGDEYRHSCFHRSQTESLPDFAELKTTVLSGHECAEKFCFYSSPGAP
jgi:hypothetical protein